MDGQLRLQFGDPPSCGYELGLDLAGRSGTLPGVDEMLTTPDIDRLFTDAKVMGDLPDRPTGVDKIKDFAAELGRVTAGHWSLLE